ncbi:FAD-binding oxidoreductase [Flavihumibacter fluvii]|uniref:FAD-binding oxidoreductase n=1 Tax=Flavihumibacter fluvii TaxID=2838157 RepID=UPI001BDE28A1|nr:FAD-binding oxidoreductase [Flavihumibacter fluvii]ULQ52766.1 FAD-binding oxidoreductase [Flavihumibacter fluvii]
MKKSVSNWGNYPVIESDERFFTLKEKLNSLLKEDKQLIARGNGRCYGDAGLADQIISTVKFDKVLAFDTTNGIFECQSGLTLDKILDVIVPKGWFLPVTPGTKFISVGGAVASDIHGKNHHVDGSFSNHVMEIELILASGETIICTPELHHDLFTATCGGMGLTGIITRVKFGLKKIETAYIKQKQVKARNLDHVLELFEEYKHYTYSVAWIDCLKKGSHFGRSILILGEHASKDDLTEKQKTAPLVLPIKKQVSIPFFFPSFVLNKWSVQLFNFLYYNKNFKNEINNVVPYEPFFYPLDAILNWNRGYGRKGFVQYQFVLPLSQKDGLTAILQKISSKGLGSFLAVLKVFGKQESLISFPDEGYTLALDFPVRKGLFDFLDELDQMVLQFGGRIYLSKDARMKPEIFWKSYPHAVEFADIVRKYDPGSRFSSVQSKRLLQTK